MIVQRKFGPKYVWVIPRDLVKLGNRIKFEGTECSAPKNPENYLRFRYGENWRCSKKIGRQLGMMGAYIVLNLFIVEKFYLQKYFALYF